MDALVELIQGSEDWKLARVGSLGASRLHEAIATVKSGYKSSRANLKAELVLERLTGRPAEKFITQAMQYGTMTEPEARSAYAFYADASVIEVGIVKHPTIDHSHASPDGLVGKDGLLEIKCPQPAAHLETIMGQTVPANHLTQVTWQMICTGRTWCDYVSYNSSFPEHMKLWIKRIMRPEDMVIDRLEKEVVLFLSEVDAAIADLRKQYG